MNLKNLFFALCVFCSSFALVTQANAAMTVPKKWHLPCSHVLDTTLPTFIRQENFEPFDVRDMNVTVQMMNDLMCEDPERMMNAVITVETRTEKWYGIFHIHWLANGEVKSANHYGLRWRQYKEDSEWRTAWCEYIRTVYPEDHSLQCLAK